AKSLVAMFSSTKGRLSNLTRLHAVRVSFVCGFPALGLCYIGFATVAYLAIIFHLDVALLSVRLSMRRRCGRAARHRGKREQPDQGRYDGHPIYLHCLSLSRPIPAGREWTRGPCRKKCDVRCTAASRA